MPTTTQYTLAIQNLSATAGDPELRDGQAAVNRMGLPLQYSGNFAVVYQIRCPRTGKTRAVKCFHQRYAASARALCGHLAALAASPACHSWSGSSTSRKASWLAIHGTRS